MKIQCTSCGGEYEDTEQKCPYCGTENKAVARREMSNILNSFDTAAAEMEKTVPRKHLKMWSKKLRLIVVAACGMVVALAMFAVFKGKWDSASDREKGNKYIVQLEKYYEAEDYENMKEYLREKDLYGHEYEKYREVCDVEEYVRWCMEQVEDFQIDRDTLTGLQPEQYEQCMMNDVENIFYYGCRAYRTGNEAFNDTNFLNNETRIKELLQKLDDYLTDTGFPGEAVDALQMGDEEQKELFQELMKESWQNK